MSSDLLSKFFDAPEYEGIDLDIVPRGRYPVRLVGVRADVSSQKTSVNVMFRFEVLEGPYAGRTIVVRKSLANVFDPDVNETYLSSSATLTKYLGCAFKKDVANKVDMFESSAHAAKEFYNLESAVGNKLIINVGIETAEQQTARAAERGTTLTSAEDRNTLLAWYRWDDPDNGYEAWKAKHLPKQIAAASRTGNGGKAGGGEGVGAVVL